MRKVQVWNGKRFVTHQEVRIGDMTETAATATEAKAALESRVETALSGSYTPSFVRHGSYLLVVWRSPDGWQYTITDQESGLLGTCHMPANVTRTECETRARLHFAMNFVGGEEGLSLLSDPESIKTYQKDMRFQALYKQYRAEGLSDMEAHQKACWNS